MDYDKLLADRLGEPSSAIRARVEAARAIQRDRLAKPLPEDTLSAQRNGGLLNKSNADMGPAEVREYCKLDEAGKALVKAAMSSSNSAPARSTASSSSPAPSPISTAATASRPTTSPKPSSIDREGRCSGFDLSYRLLRATWTRLAKRSLVMQLGRGLCQKW